ncbi:hypothetical protein Nepgr_031708 [Nepenthes gracilis]|uniref:Uncharacterized protein n=1 Tax=Nepenthes gracilis TaxID=150966 RepID=A0AAD3Y736_NEPGR|nr:hypothetical protein Nepgr_031708 [Nepenthes gracilis]
MKPGSRGSKGRQSDILLFLVKSTCTKIKVTGSDTSARESGKARSELWRPWWLNLALEMRMKLGTVGHHRPVGECKEIFEESCPHSIFFYWARHFKGRSGGYLPSEGCQAERSLLPTLPERRTSSSWSKPSSNKEAPGWIVKRENAGSKRITSIILHVES